MKALRPTDAETDGGANRDTDALGAIRAERAALESLAAGDGPMSGWASRILAALDAHESEREDKT